MKTKSQPLIPVELTENKADTIKQVVADPAKRKELKVSLKVSGGIPSQSYRFKLNISGDGASSSSLYCTMKKQDSKGEARLETKQLNQLFNSIIKSNILNFHQAPPLFLPDTLIGILEISNGSEVHSIYFAADENQAAVQNMKTPPGVKQVLDHLYGIGNKILKLRSVKP